MNSIAPFQWDVISGEHKRPAATCDILGLEISVFPSNEEAFLGLVLPSDRDRVHRRLATTTPDNPTYEIEYRICLRDGSQRSLIENGEVFFGENNSAEMVIGTISARVEETDISLDILKLNKIVNEQADAVVIIDIDGIIRFANPAAERIVNKKSEKLVGSQFGIPLTHDDVTEVQMLIPDKGLIYAEMHTVHTDWDGEPAQLVSFRDITERKHAEQELLESQQKYRSICYSATTVAIISIGADNNLTAWNLGAQRIFGYKEDDVLGQPITRFIPMRDWEPHEADLKRIAETGENHLFGKTIELRGQHKNGIEIPVELSLGVWHSNKGPQFSIVITDTTERKLAMAQLIQSSKLATLGEMATGLAHELNQPLNIIRMSSDTLTEVLKEDDIPSHDFLNKRLERISSQTQRAASIIDRMRVFGRTPQDHAMIISPRDAVFATSDMMKEQLRLCEIELALDVPETCPSVKGDLIQLEQVLLNLLTNARDAIEERATKTTAGENGPRCITITLKDAPATKTIELMVQDTGGGIPQNVVHKIFDPFLTTKEIGKGTGLGLSISYGIITDMGGTITAGNVDEGALFTVTLPAVNEDQQENPEMRLQVQ